MTTNPNDVELKISYGDDDVDVARDAFGLRSGDGSKLDIWFCEHITRRDGEAVLGLDAVGLIVRLRRRKGGEDDDSAVKIRGHDLRLPTEVPQDLKVEGDWTVTGRQVSASLSETVPEGLIRPNALAGGVPEGIFSEAQAGLYRGCAPDGAELGRLHPLGPVEAIKWGKREMRGIDPLVAAEEWSAGDLRFLELSIRVPFTEGEVELASFLEWADEKTDHLPVLPSPKTAMVLRHFAASL